MLDLVRNLDNLFLASRLKYPYTVLTDNLGDHVWWLLTLCYRGNDGGLGRVDDLLYRPLGLFAHQLLELLYRETTGSALLLNDLYSIQHLGWTNFLA